MKIILLQEENNVQLVLTPETEFEKKALDAIPDNEFHIKRGEYYACQGGWTRESNGKESLMFVMRNE